jgi:hypothetical protein
VTFFVSYDIHLSMHPCVHVLQINSLLFRLLRCKIIWFSTENKWSYIVVVMKVEVPTEHNDNRNLECSLPCMSDYDVQQHNDEPDYMGKSHCAISMFL